MNWIKNSYVSIYAVIGILVFFMLAHIEFIINQKYAPENVLIQVKTDKGLPEVNAQCFADIASSQVSAKKKPLKQLESIYDFLAARTFSANEEKGFHLLETEFNRYKGKYDIKIVCYSDGLRGVSHTIIDNANTADCEIKDDGKLLLC